MVVLVVSQLPRPIVASISVDLRLVLLITIVVSLSVIVVLIILRPTVISLMIHFVVILMVVPSLSLVPKQVSLQSNVFRNTPRHIPLEIYQLVYTVVRVV